LNEASVLHNLRKRYDHDLIYTYSGLFLVAINPYKRIPLYTPEMINIYRGRRRNEVAPHVFSISDEAYRQMLNNRMDQSLLITGESGAGKTENTKKVIQYIAFVAGRASEKGMGELEQQLLECNPLLEAFGNAKTNRNDNSSRFGKFIRLQFTSGGQVAGASIRQYLLEKNRIVFQAKGERSFHIFYQLPAGASADEKKKFLLDKPEKFRYLNGSGCTTVAGVDDVEEFKHTVLAMKVMDFKQDEIDSVFRTVSGILWLGNIKFENNRDAAEIRDKTALNNVAQLWGVDAAALEAGLVKPRIKAGTEIVATQLSPERADYSRNALAKHVYAKLFARIVKAINRTLEKENQNHFIGILDIAGFEIFEFNSFEQICINYTNERLQQFFNNHMFKIEQEEYLREQINWTFIDFGMDSQDRIDLIDKKPIGILALLEEESFFPKATDETFLAKVTGAHSRNTHFKKPKFQKGTFRLAHYAGEVEYDVKGWLEKNRDPLQEDLELVMKKSRQPFVTELFSEEFKPQEFVTQSASGKKSTGSGLSGQLGREKRKGAIFVTVGTHHKEQLNDLMETLYATEPHFVRCILPNHEKRPGSLEAEIVMDQLRCNGVLEGIRISRKGFPNRIVYAEFLRRYYLLNDKINKHTDDPRQATEKIMSGLKGINPEEYRFGLTKIFFRTGCLAAIEELREQKIGLLLTSIQAAARGWIGRRLSNKLKTQAKAAKIIQRSIRAWLDFQTWPWYMAWMKAKPIIEMMYWDSTYRRKKAELEALTNELKAIDIARKALEDKISQGKLTIEGVQQTTAAERQVKEGLLAEKAALDAKRGELEKRIDQVKKDIDTEEQERRELTALKNKKASQADELDAELKKETKIKQSLEQLKRDNEAKIADLQGSVQAAEEKIARLEAAKRNLERDVAELKDSVGNEADTVSALEKAKKQLTAEIEQLRDELDKLRNLINTLLDGKRKVEADLATTRGQLSDTKSNREAHEAAAKQLQGEITALRDKIMGVEKGADAASGSVKKLEDDIAHFKAQIAEEKETKNNLDKNKRRLETELADLTGKMREESAQRAELEEAKRNNETELARLKVQLESALAKITSLEKAKAGLEAQQADLASRVEKESQDKDVLLKANKRLQQELEDVNGKIGDRGAHRAEVDRVRNQLQKQYNDIKAQYEAVRRRATTPTRRSASSRLSCSSSSRPSRICRASSRPSACRPRPPRTRLPTSGRSCRLPSRLATAPTSAASSSTRSSRSSRTSSRRR
jgi:myosin protein heavy chain